MRNSNESGIAMITVLLVLMLMSALLVGFTTVVMSDQRYRFIDRDRGQAFYAASAGVEHAVRTLRFELEGTGIRVLNLRCGETMGTDFATREGTLYPLLSRMRSEGQLDYDWRESAAGPPRKYYRLTGVGRDHLAEFRAYWASLTTLIDELGR